MGRWSAVSDYDYDDEINGRSAHISTRCRTCGEPMQVVTDSDGRPVWCRCDACARDRAMEKARTA